MVADSGWLSILSGHLSVDRRSGNCRTNGSSVCIHHGDRPPATATMEGSTVAASN